MNVRITGTGSALPARILTNAEISQMVDTSDEWITTRTGIRERRIAAEGEYTSTLAAEAGRNALAMAGVAAEEIDLLLVSTVTPDFPFPSTACIVQDLLGATNATAFDLSAACAGFIFGLSVADKYIRSGAVKKILVIGAEVLSRTVDWRDRNTCVLFGDGAGAVVLEATDGEHELLSTHTFSKGAFWNLLYQQGSGSRNPATDRRTIDEERIYLTMEGNDVFKHAVRAMEEASTAALVANGISGTDLSFLIPHQANQRIIDATAKRLGIGPERLVINLDRYGNTSSASIPIALDEAHRNGVIKSGNLVMMVAFGAGFAYGSTLVRW
ncbi:MAG TPA: ketoacyl-ACP synthase III [Desulfuromonadales bacterium]|nr:ketoacyl-ACP synthase III [Desulfuromonadales bacterium]